MDIRLRRRMDSYYHPLCKQTGDHEAFRVDRELKARAVAEE